MFEHLLFRKLPVWLFVLSLLLALLAVFGFGVLTYDAVAGPGRFGPIGRAAGFVSGLPEAAWQSIRSGDPMLARHAARYGDRAGWTVEPGPGTDGYLLVSRFDGSRRRHVVELVDLATFETLHRWLPDPDRLFDGLSTEGQNREQIARRAPDLFRAIHPLPTDDGGLIVKDHDTALFRVGPCGDVAWRQSEAIFHHSTERAADGSYWVVSYADRLAPELAVGDEFRKDALAQFAPDGQLLQQISMTEVLVDAGLMPHFMTMFRGAQIKDAMHVNDIQPVLQDGPHWRQGDLFLSLRHMSMIALFRPSTGDIVWWRRGPWLSQHDVDIVDDHTISVYSNNAYDAGMGGRVYGHNQVMLYDFGTDEVTLPYDAAMAELEVLTVSEGLSEMLPGGAVLIEEENNGRLLIVRPDGTLLAEFVNRADDGRVYRLGWSRYLDRQVGDRLRDTLGDVACAGTTPAEP